MNRNELTRRAFLASTTVSAVGAGATVRMNTAKVVPRKVSPNEKLNIAAVGAGGMGFSNLRACSTENIVALCYVDHTRAKDALELFPKASRHTDFRRMFDSESKEIDAVIVATPDHTHAVIAMAAMRLGKHVYCQKPLAHSIHEVRALTAAARESGVQTQMGNQGHSSDEIRQLCEWIDDGAIGAVREVHAWSDRPVGGDPWSNFPMMARPVETPPVPDSLDWDLWLGPAPYRPYHPVYCPLQWRGFYDFGTGPLGDMGCHILDPAFVALRLGAPETVQATSSHFEEGVSSETYPRASIVRYRFPEREAMPAVDLTWYDGRLLPPIPAAFAPGDAFHRNGALFIGETGCIMHKSHGAGGLQLFPKELHDDYKRPAARLPRVKDGAHEQDWIRACKDGNPASSHFEYGGALTEMVLLGVLAIRVKDKRLAWNSETLRVTNNEEANALVNPPYRDGWSL